MTHTGMLGLKGLASVSRPKSTGLGLGLLGLGLGLDLDYLASASS